MERINFENNFLTDRVRKKGKQRRHYKVVQC